MVYHQFMKHSNDYIYSKFYKEHFAYGKCTWRNGTQSARRFWYHWGNPEARYIRCSIKEFRALARNQARSIRRNALKRISVDSNEELIEEVETIIFQSENKFGKWYWFD